MECYEESRAPQLDALIVKIASRCNLNCGYCYLYNHEDTTFRSQPKFMTLDVFVKTMERTREFLEQTSEKRPISVILHGGEPTLVGAERLDAYCRLAKETLGDLLASIGIQTNATLLTEPILAVIKRNQISIGVSMDGPSAVHNAQRVYKNGKDSYSETVAGILALQAHAIEVRVLCVVQPGVDGGEVYDHFRALGIQNFDFLLPDVSHDNKERLYGRFGPTPVARYLTVAFDRWIAEDDPRVNIRLFRGMLRSIFGGSGENDAFGNPLMSYAVIESNGDIEALDALKVCRNGIAATGLNVQRNRFSEIRGSGSVLARAMFEGIAPAACCRSCPEYGHCGGGYLPHRYSREREFDNPSVWCEDIKALFGHIRASLPAHA